MTAALHWKLFWAFAAVWLAILGSWLLGWEALAGSEWTGWILIALGGAVAVSGHGLRLPAQNIWMALLAVAALSWLFEFFYAKGAYPPRQIAGWYGARLLGVPPVVLLLWIGAIFVSREMARLLLVPWRNSRNYGFWVVGIAAGLTVHFQMALELFGGTNWGWGASQGLDFPARCLMALLILAALTPWMIDKRRINHPPRANAAGIWLGWHLLLGTSGFSAGVSVLAILHLALIATLASAALWQGRGEGRVKVK
jgi:hypothetical protein